MLPGAARWFILVAIVAPPLAVGAQTLVGRVHTSASLPVAGAYVAPTAGGASAITDSVGHFVLAHAPAGETPFTIRRIGYEPARFTVDIARNDTTEIEIMLTEQAQTLPAMQVQATNPGDALLARFYDHRASSGGGHFFERADIERAQPHRLTDMLRGIPGIRLETNPIQQSSVRMNRARLGAFGDCPVQYWLDGMRVQEFDLDELAPRDVEALEIYAGPATLPPEYRTMAGTAICGTIAIWTRVPVKP
jgi:CarboxypepD_reg-like domain/TonB-dependent Receptor Plug Domain